MKKKRSISLTKYQDNNERRNFLSNFVTWVGGFILFSSLDKEAGVFGIKRAYAENINNNEGNSSSQELAEINNVLADVNNKEYILKGDGIDPTGKTISSGIQVFFDKVAQTGGGVISIPYGTYRLNTILRYYPDKISLIAGKTATFQFEQTSGYCVEIQAYESLYVKDYLEQAFTRSISGIKFKALNDGVFLFRSKGDLKGKYASGWKFKDCSFIGGNSFEINSDTWVAAFDHCYFKPVGYGVYMPGNGKNYGEKITIHGCVFDGAQTAFFNGNGQGDIHVTQTSIDYCHNAVTVKRGIVSLDEVFVESSYIDNHQFIVDGYGATLNFGFLQFTDTYRSKRPLELFKISDNSTDLMGAGIIGNVFKLIAGYSTTPLLVKGTGPVDIGKIIEYKDGHKPVIARYMNRLAFGNCNSEESISEWTRVPGSILPTLDKTTFYEGKGSLKFSSSMLGKSGNIAMRLKTACRPGQTIRLRFFLKTKNIKNSGLSLNIDRNFLNATGTSISSGNMKTIDTNMDWTDILIVPSIQAPQGTEYVEITFWCDNWKTDLSAWIDDIVLNIV